jgi:hypothetical protein
MSDDTSAKPQGGAGDGRRQTDRRQSLQTFDGPDRRKGDRRAGADRRATQRSDDLDEGEG